MRFQITFINVFILIALAIPVSCNGNDVSQTPVTPLILSGLSGQNNYAGVANHYLWGFFLIVANPGSNDVSVIPVRVASNHWNVRKFLENGPCLDCLKVTGVTPGYDGTTQFDVEISHPFLSANVTGFDVRGIAMFNGSNTFPVSGLTVPDGSNGDGELLNADGYTTLYNSGTLGSGPGELQGYSKGKFASASMPDADLNGFMRYVTDDPANTRNAFYAGDTVTMTYELMMPTSGFVFGYAIDASWVPPTVSPVSDPMTDFPPEANCPEPWHIDVFIAPTGPGLQPNGGEVTLTANVYDYQGVESHSAPTIECPELFVGTKTMNWVSDNAGFSTWVLPVSNEILAPSGPYKCLVSVVDDENAGSPSYLNLTGYQIVTLRVGGGNLVWVEAAGGTELDVANGIASFDDDSVVITGSFAGSATFGSGEPNEVTLDSSGETDIFVAKYNPDGTLDWARSAGGGSFDRGTSVAAVSDGSLVVTGYFQGTAIFGQGDPFETSLISEGGTDIFIAMYSPTGTISWVKSAKGAEWDGGNGIDIYPDNSFVITGYYEGSVLFGEGEPGATTLVSEGEDDIFIARYTLSPELLWAKSAGGADFEEGDGVTALPDYSCMLTGYFMDSAIFGQGEPNQTGLVSLGESDVFIAKFNQDGNLTWAKRAGGTDNEGGIGIDVLNDQSTILTGYFRDASTFGDGEPGEVTLTSAGVNDMFIARYNPDGILMWAKRAGGEQSDRGESVAVLSDSSIVVAGVYIYSAIFGEGEQNEVTLTGASGTNEICIARFDPHGLLLWAKNAGGNFEDDEGNGIVALSDDSMVACGYFTIAATFGPGESEELTILGAGESEAWVARFLP